MDLLSKVPTAADNKEGMVNSESLAYDGLSVNNPESGSEALEKAGVGDLEQVCFLPVHAYGPPLFFHHLLYLPPFFILLLSWLIPLLMTPDRSITCRPSTMCHY
jgi:hypothetical protein